MDSNADILEAAANGVLAGADDGNGGTLLTLGVGANTVTLTLDGVDLF